MARKAANKEAAPELEAAAAPANNVIFIGRQHRNGGTKFLNDAPQKLISGDVVFNDLPPFEIQKKGFYHPQAALLCRAFPTLYKQIKKLGE